MYCVFGGSVDLVRCQPPGPNSLSNRPVRWQATYDRKGNFLRSWGLALAMGIPLAIGFALLIVPGVLLSLYWFHAPALVADGRSVLEAIRESGRIFERRRDWAAYFLNWLVLAVLWGARWHHRLRGAAHPAALARLPRVLLHG